MFGFGKKDDKKKPDKPASEVGERVTPPPVAPAAMAPLFPQDAPQAPAPAAMAPLFPQDAPAAQPAAPPQPPVQKAAAQAAPITPSGEWRTPAIISFKPHELNLTQEQLEAAFASAREENDAGAPFGGALWATLMQMNVNWQNVDLLVDELPNEAFGHPPGAHFSIILRCWVRAMAHREHEWAGYKQLAMAAGWRPGDANGLELFEAFHGDPLYLGQSKHPMGLDVLPEQIELSPHESAVYMHMQRLLAEGEKATLQ